MSIADETADLREGVDASDDFPAPPLRCVVAEKAVP